MSLDMLFTKESMPFVYLLVLDEGLDAQPRMKKKILFLNLIQIQKGNTIAANSVKT